MLRNAYNNLGSFSIRHLIYVYHNDRYDRKLMMADRLIWAKLPQLNPIFDKRKERKEEDSEADFQTI